MSGLLLYRFRWLSLYNFSDIAIWHRNHFTDTSDPQNTIENYFTPGKWEVNVIEAIYLIHLYSVFPEFLLISKYHPYYQEKEPSASLVYPSRREERSTFPKSYTLPLWLAFVS